MAKRHERTFSRQMALKALYMSMVTGETPAELARCAVELPDDGHLPDYACRLLTGVSDQQLQIDSRLDEASENWSVERMPAVDHAILLLATYEMLNIEEVPVSVCINEAVELAKAYGGEDDSARFVNGLLGRIARTYCAERIEEPGDSKADDEAVDEGSIAETLEA